MNVNNILGNFSIFILEIHHANSAVRTIRFQAFSSCFRIPLVFGKNYFFEFAFVIYFFFANIGRFCRDRNERLRGQGRPISVRE